MSLSEFEERYKDLESGARLPEHEVRLAGRVLERREASKSLMFIDLFSDKTMVQVMASKFWYGDKEKYAQAVASLSRGDIIGITGIPGKSKTNQLSILPSEINILAKCTKPLGSITHGDELKDPEIRFRQRYLDFIMNTKNRDIFYTRTKVIDYLRTFLKARGFLEVETPILSSQAGGANATPFETVSKTLNASLQLRIAPELYLKQLIIGGFDKVFEIGKVFRNEGVSAKHNPEFTTCEFYEAYSDYNKLMDFSETFLSNLIQELFQSTSIEVLAKTADNDDATVRIDFKPPFKRLYVKEELEKCLGQPLPDLTSPTAVEELISLCRSHNIATPTPHTKGRLLDRLIGHFIEPQCVQPTFICDHPIPLSPLAKEHEAKPGYTERFELFVNKVELINAYSELNEPLEQRKRFADQMKDRVGGDADAQILDEDFCEALEYGMPPTAGWGMGIDRFIMLIIGAKHIREVILFPTVKPQRAVMTTSVASTDTPSTTSAVAAVSEGSE